MYSDGWDGRHEIGLGIIFEGPIRGGIQGHTYLGILCTPAVTMYVYV